MRARLCRIQSGLCGSPGSGRAANQLRCGNIKATIRENVSEKPFKDQSGAWRNGTSFGLSDLEALVTVAREAKEWMAAHALKR